MLHNISVNIRLDDKTKLDEWNKTIDIMTKNISFWALLSEANCTEGLWTF